MPNADLAFWGARAWPNPPGGGIGQTIASAATFTPVAPVHHLSGVGTVTTIVPPYTGFTGKITVIADGIMVFNTGGTAGSAIGATVTTVAARAYELVYDGAVWYVN